MSTPSHLNSKKLQWVQLISPIDGKAVSITPAAGYKKLFQRRKCFTAYCTNPIWFVLLSRTGKAASGKCWPCAELRATHNHLTGNRKYESWRLLEKGRLSEPWEFHQKTLQFSPVPESELE